MLTKINPGTETQILNELAYMWNIENQMHSNRLQNGDYQ
jgi:hypothetical protein